jgi:hypothetical protein
MAKVHGPLFSENASGSVTPVLTFSVRNSGQQVRYQRKQKDRITAGRIVARANYSDAVVLWNLLSVSEKSDYNLLAIGKHMTGYNYFLKLNIGALISYTSFFFGEAFFGSCWYGFEG